MNAQNKLLDTARMVCKPQTDSEVAARLGLTKAAVSMWRHGGKIRDEHLMALIDLAQADPAIAVKVREEEAVSPAERKAWGALWDRLSPVTTTVIGVLALVALGVHAGAHEGLQAALPGLFITGNLYTLCEMLAVAAVVTLAVHHYLATRRTRTPA